MLRTRHEAQSRDTSTKSLETRHMFNSNFIGLQGDKTRKLFKDPCLAYTQSEFLFFFFPFILLIGYT